MKLSILTMITKPDERQDMWREALENYKTIADEVIVVSGSPLTNIPKGVKVYYLHWKEDWNYIELPKHLNFGLKKCTGDWVLKLDIDHLLDEDNIKRLKPAIDYNNITSKKESLALEKLHFVADMRYRLKGKQIICFDRSKDIKFGKLLGQLHIDLCHPVVVDHYEIIDGYELPIGKAPTTLKSGVCYWNYNFTFKTKKVAKEHFWRWVRAWCRLYKEGGLSEYMQKGGITKDSSVL